MIKRELYRSISPDASIQQCFQKYLLAGGMELKYFDEESGSWILEQTEHETLNLLPASIGKPLSDPSAPHKSLYSWYNEFC